MTNPNATAFPLQGDSHNYTVGLTKREWFAGMALPECLRQNGVENAHIAAEDAWKAADEMIAKSNQKTESTKQ